MEAGRLPGGALRLGADRLAASLPRSRRFRSGRRRGRRQGRSARIPEMKVSLVVPVFNEEENLEEFLRRVTAVLDTSRRPYEIILVDDGSRDRSLEILKAWAARRSDVVRVLELSRNFGQHPAIMAGFRDVTGDVAVTLDADLQNPPEEIPKLLAKFEEGYDVVGGVRQHRQDSWARRAASALVNRITVAITRMKLTDFGCMLRAYSR